MRIASGFRRPLISTIMSTGTPYAREIDQRVWPWRTTTRAKEGRPDCAHASDANDVRRRMAAATVPPHSLAEDRIVCVLPERPMVPAAAQDRAPARQMTSTGLPEIGGGKTWDLVNRLPERLLDEYPWINHRQPVR